ncbi:hydroxysqualene dehydroxylase HpnE [Methylotenera mobilis]|uniref:Squalene-associated FAD-dependent desaturase n=1 Tax=Methylotenera mobilis (strain JLW8 / ATCC BAA-1282 / DSM 17540) TaxID=583345 RepID=C6WVY5_METML|nr:hydroxysqualene dehydroxylase HpnE [Methylotenera mobilis]ACT48084.1 squalene-associated FAD-dependent desaturase [Methylotenera mobilis JLW8]
MNTHQHIAIIGGGCAGLSAAATLTERGYAVTLFEASSQLGGRARSVVVENKDLLQLLDNGQHILLGAYNATLSLLEKAGVKEEEAFLRLPLQLNMQSALTKATLSLKSAHYLPAPLNLLVGFLFSKGLTFGERIAALKFMRYLQASGYEIHNDLSLASFLKQHKQSRKLIQMLWEPLCLAALNTPLKKASSRIFLNVLRDTFSGHKKNSDFLIPKLELSKIISQPLAHYIQAKGGTIKLNHRIRSLVEADHGFHLETKHGMLHFSHVIVATSPARTDKLLAQLPKLKASQDKTHHYQYQPIYTVYLQYPVETKLPQVMTGLTNSTSQWVFDRGELCGEKGLLAVIVSAEGAHQKLTQDALALSVANELKQVFPHLPKPLWHKVIAEKRATFACLPDLARPTNRTAQNNLYLAGDYTYASYPATIEGAVRSGIYCANLIANAS